MNDTDLTIYAEKVLAATTPNEAVITMQNISKGLERDFFLIPLIQGLQECFNTGELEATFSMKLFGEEASWQDNRLTITIIRQRISKLAKEELLPNINYYPATTHTSATYPRWWLHKTLHDLKREKAKKLIENLFKQLTLLDEENSDG